jgi:hypothetical protein
MVYQALVASQRTKVINSPYIVLHISNWQVEWKTLPITFAAGEKNTHVAKSTLD